jgi:hypothetical protein
MQVSILAIRIVGFIVKSPLPGLEKIMPIIVQRLFQIIVSFN